MKQLQKYAENEYPISIVQILYYQLSQQLGKDMLKLKNSKEKAFN